MRRWKILGILGVTFFWGGIAHAEMERVTACVPQHRAELLTAEVLLAKDNGFFKGAGLDVDVAATEYSCVVVRRSLQSAQECAFGVTTIEKMFVCQVDLNRIKPLQVYLYGFPYDTHLVVRKESGIKTVGDLRGKAVKLGQIPTRIAMKKILREGGMTFEDIQMVRSLSVHVLDKMERGEIDAAITYFPTMPLMLASGKVNILKANIFSNYVTTFIPHAALWVNTEFAEKNPGSVEKFLDGLGDAERFMKSNPSELIKAFTRNSSLLGLGGWQVDNTLAEKSSVLFGDFHLHGLGDSLYVDEQGKAVSVYDSIVRYENLLNKEGYLSGKKNTSKAWEKYVR